jgi:hypothetical protein
MNRLALSVPVLLVGFDLAMGVAAARDDPMRGYYGNTLACYWPGVFQCRVWWNKDGSETYFEARYLPEGIITMKTVDGRWSMYVANNQYCVRDARLTASPENTKKPLPPPPKPEDDAALAARNGCQPITDAMPGDHWFKLHGNGWYQNEREQFVLLAGHQ